MMSILQRLNSRYMESNPDDTNPGGGGGNEAAPSGLGTEDANNWRDQFVGGDEKLAAQLERFTEPTDLGKAYMDARAKISEGFVAPTLGENPDEEQVAAYREQVGVPATADKYFSEMPEGLVLNEDDQEIFGDLAETLHQNNISRDSGLAIVDWYNQYSEKIDADTHESDVAMAHKAEEIGREKWGGDYRANMNVANTYLSNTYSDESLVQLQSARLADGTPLFSHPEFIEQMVRLGREANPIASVITDGSATSETLTDEITSLEKYMREKPNEWFKDDAAQAKLRGLYTAQDKVEEQNKAQAARG